MQHERLHSSSDHAPSAGSMSRSPAPASPDAPSTAPVPTPLSRRQRAARAARRTARYSAWTLLGLILLVLAAGAGFWYWSARDQSLDTVLRMVRGYLPANMALEASGVSGTVRQGGRIERLVYTMQGTDAGGYSGGQLVVTLDDITVQWDLASLSDRATRFGQFHVKTATLQDTRIAKPLTALKEPLQSLTLPVSVELPFEIDTLRMVGRPHQEDIAQDSPAQAAAAASAAKQADTLQKTAAQRQRLAPKAAASASSASVGQLAASAASALAAVASAAQSGKTAATASVLAGESAGPAASSHARDTVITQIKGRYDYDHISAQHKLQLDALTVASGTWQGKAMVEGRAPMRSQIEAGGVLDIPASAQMPAQRLRATTRIQGTLAGADALLEVSAHVTPLPLLPATSASPVPAGQGTQLDLQANVQPWKTQPLARAHANWQQLDVQAFWPGAPRTRLRGALALEPVAGQRPARAASAAASAPAPVPAPPAANASAASEGQAPGMLGFLGNSHWQLALQAHNDDSGPWDKGQLPMQQIQLQAQYRAGVLDVSTLDARLGGGGLQGQGRYDPAQGWQGDVAVRGLNPGLIYSSLAAAPISGTLTAHAPLQAGADPAQTPVEFALKLAPDGGRRAARNGLALDRVDVQGRWQQQTVHLPQLLVRMRDAALQGSASYAVPAQAVQADLRLTLPGSQASVKGAISASNGQGALQANVVNLQQTMQWLQQWPGAESLRQQVLTGSARLDAQWRGGWQHNGSGMHLNARLDAPAITLRQASVAPGADTVIGRTRLAVQGTLAQAAIDGSSHVQQGTRSIDLALRGTAGKLAQGWRAQLQATQLQLKDQLQNKSWLATLAQPVAIQVMQGNGALQVQTGAFAVNLSGPAPGNAQVLAEPIRLVQQGNGYTLHSKGRLTDVPLAWVDALSSSSLSSNGLAGDLALAGDWDVQLGHAMRVHAVLQRSQGDLVVMAGEGSGGRVQAGIRQAQLEITGSGSQVQARLLWDSANAGAAQATLASRLGRTASGGWTLPPHAPLQGQINANLPRVGLWSMFAPPGWRLRGTLQTALTVGGTVSAPQLHGALDADNLGVRSVVDGIAFSQGKLRTRLSGQRLDIDEFSLQGPSVNRMPGGSATVTGHVQWGAPGANMLQGLQMQLAARLHSLQLSSMPERQIVLSGDINAQLASQRLTVRGNLKVDRALIEIPADIAPRLDHDVVIRPSQKHAKAVLAQPAQNAVPAAPPPAAPHAGAASAADDIVLRPSRNAAANRAAPAQNTPAGNSAAPKVSAQVRAGSGPGPAVAAARPTAPRVNSAIVPDIQIRIDMGEDLRVRGHGLDTRLRGTLQLENGPTLQALPRLTGAIRTDRGTFRAYGQELNIESGRIEFRGALDNPYLDISAIRPNLGNEMRVGVRIRGMVQRLQVQLFSEPEMPDAEKLSWLVLGRSSAGAADAALLQQAAMALLAGNGRGITGELADALGLDELSFHGGDDGSLSSASVTLGKRFSSNFYVAYERGLDATLGTLYFFYEISRRLKLRGQTGAESAVDLIYTISYD